MKVLLWDIDGTLICSGQAGERAINYAMEEVFGIRSSLEHIDYRGRTDRFIGYQLFEYYGVEPTPEHLHCFIESYLRHLESELPKSPGKTHRGVVDILQQAHDHPGFIQGLLTGNMRRGAELKLTFYKVWHFFSFGAFADDSVLRNELGPIALERAAEVAGHSIEPEKVYVIGDTPHDIECGKVIGAQTVAVATGAYDVKTLERYSPSVVFPDLGDTKTFWSWIENHNG
ncbi:MAG: haloacid dehalogenase-like hydrolase [Methylacidiphilales bacterium]|nr:haloacid dehalogenase-like hydrolase [Candidatus Methylacidiphilales bacterium]MDW8349695.1 haloacid dehalogenase-like hydrolase [Verrucomicrobiae bacterium]